MQLNYVLLENPASATLIDRNHTSFVFCTEATVSAFVCHQISVKSVHCSVSPTLMVLAHISVKGNTNVQNAYEIERMRRNVLPQ